jgi:hypothetical protein
MSEAPERIWVDNWLADVGERATWDMGEWRNEPWPTVDVVEYVRADRIEELEAKMAKAAKWFDEIRRHCANFGRGVPSIDERIIERCEDTAVNALAELKGDTE